MGRNKPGKPRRERPEPTEHTHAGFEIPEDFEDPEGRPVDHKLLSALVGAAFDGCLSCQDPLLTLLVEDPATTARLVELACIIVQNLFGGLPASMTYPGHDPSNAFSVEFRRLAYEGLDGAHEAMGQMCAAMPVVNRRAAANTALNQVVGGLASGQLVG